MKTTYDKSIALMNEYLNVLKNVNKSADNYNDLINDSFINKLIERLNGSQIDLIISNDLELWLKIVKNSLKISLKEELVEELSEKLLQILTHLLNNLSPNKTSLETTFELICGHSVFNNIMIDENYISSKVKTQLISLLSIIYEKDMKLFKKNTNEMIELVLSSYNCSLSRSDQQLLRLLKHFEEKDCNLYRYQPFLWGVNGANHYSTRKTSKTSLLKDPKMEEILSAIDQKCLKRSLNNFPIGIKLNAIEIIDLDNGQTLLDPRFLLPLLYHLLSSQSLVKCHKFVSFGSLSFSIACLSSDCKDMRSLAYCVLSRFYSHLESATFPRDRFLWIGLIDFIRSGITSDNVQILSLIVVFIIRTIDVLLHPNDKLFPSVKHFLINRPTLQLNILPNFYDTMTSPDIENFKRLQRFNISWICDGLRTEGDIKLCLKRNVFTEMLLLFDSPLIDRPNQGLILDLLQNCCQIYLGAKVLCTENAIICWSKQSIFTVKTYSNSSILIEKLYRIIDTIWETISGQHLSLTDKQTEFIFYPSFCFEIIDIYRLIVSIKPENYIINRYSAVLKSIFTVYPNYSNLYSFIIESLPINTLINESQ